MMVSKRKENTVMREAQLIIKQNNKQINSQKGCVLWLTGLSGAGKSTLAEKLYDYFRANGRKTEHLDGDNVRSIFPKTGFSEEERNNHIKIMGYIASRLENHGITVIASFISPYKESRDFVRQMCSDFVEIYVATSLDECEKRDVKGLYKKARANEIKNFTGIDDPYEKPENPELIICTENKTIDESLNEIISFINARSC